VKQSSFSSMGAAREQFAMDERSKMERLVPKWNHSEVE
jgi:hypothetical protein